MTGPRVDELARNPESTGMETTPTPEGPVRQELSAWERSRQATARIMAARGCDPNGYPLDKDSGR